MKGCSTSLSTHC